MVGCSANVKQEATLGRQHVPMCFEIRFYALRESWTCILSCLMHTCFTHVFKHQPVLAGVYSSSTLGSDLNYNAVHALHHLLHEIWKSSGSVKLLPRTAAPRCLLEHAHGLRTPSKQ